jgi:hypothetical protein
MGGQIPRAKKEKTTTTVQWARRVTYGIVGVPDEGVYCHQRQVGLALGVVDQVQVDQLLQLQVFRLDAVDHVGE